MWNTGEGTLEHHRWDSMGFHLLEVWRCLGGGDKGRGLEGKVLCTKKAQRKCCGPSPTHILRGPPCILCVQGWVRGGPAGPWLSLYSCEHSLVHPSIAPSFYSSCSESREHTHSFIPLLPLLPSVGFAHSHFSESSFYFIPSVQFSSVQSLSRVRLFATPWISACQASLSITNSDSSPSTRWCHPAISSSVVPFSSCSQSLPASESFPMSQLFAWGGQSTGVSASASFRPKNTQGWSPLEWTGWISLQSKGLSRVFSNTTVQKHQFFLLSS